MNKSNKNHLNTNHSKLEFKIPLPEPFFYPVHLCEFRHPEDDNPVDIRFVEVPIDVVNSTKNVIELLGVIYCYGQNDFTIGRKDQQRSISMGDVIQLDGHEFHGITDLGFAEIDNPWTDFAIWSF